MEAGSAEPETRPLQEAHGLLEKRPYNRGAVTIHKLNRHLLPKFFVLTVLCYIDRCVRQSWQPGSDLLTPPTHA